jgi:hypothetical protein
MKSRASIGFTIIFIIFVILGVYGKFNHDNEPNEPKKKVYLKQNDFENPFVREGK